VRWHHLLIHQQQQQQQQQQQRKNAISPFAILVCLVSTAAFFPFAILVCLVFTAAFFLFFLARPARNHIFFIYFRRGALSGVKKNKECVLTFRESRFLYSPRFTGFRNILGVSANRVWGNSFWRKKKSITKSCSYMCDTYIKINTKEKKTRPMFWYKNWKKTQNERNLFLRYSVSTSVA